MTTYALPEEFVFDKIGDSNGYIVTKLQNVPADGSANVHIRNPHPDKVMWLAGIELYGEGNAEFYLHDGFDSISDGTKITIQNALLDSGGGNGTTPDSGPFEAFFDTTFTAATDTTVPIGFTTSDGADQSKNVNIHPMAVEPNREIVIDIQNQDSNVNKSMVSILLVTSY